MSDRKYVIRIYTVHDKDLISKEGEDFPLSKAAYFALKAFANKRAIAFDLPVGDNPLQNKKQTIVREVFFDEEKDAEVIAMLESIECGARNNFMKNVIRQCMAYPIADGYLTPETNEAFKELSSVYTMGREVISLRGMGSVRRKLKEKPFIPKEEWKKTHRGKEKKESKFSARPAPALMSENKKTSVEDKSISIMQSEKREESIAGITNPQEDTLFEATTEQDAMLNSILQSMF